MALQLKDMHVYRDLLNRIYRHTFVIWNAFQPPLLTQDGMHHLQGSRRETMYEMWERHTY